MTPLSGLYPAWDSCSPEGEIPYTAGILPLEGESFADWTSAVKLLQTAPNFNLNLNGK